MVFRVLVPKVEETHYTAKQLAIPSLFQLQVHVFGATAEYMHPIEEIVRPPFANLRLNIALINSHLGCRCFTQTFQIGPYIGLAFHLTRVRDVCVCRGHYGVVNLHIILQVVEPVETPSKKSRPFDRLRVLSFLLV